MNYLLRFLRDRCDNRRARQLRDEYGPRRWLVSWYRQDDGGWLVRLSCPTLDETIERRGRTRCQGIRRAAQVIAESLLVNDFADP